MSSRDSSLLIKMYRQYDRMTFSQKTLKTKIDPKKSDAHTLTLYTITTVLPIATITLLTISVKFRHIHEMITDNNDNIYYIWWIMYFSLCIILIKYFSGVLSDYHRFKFTDNACDTVILENETLRYNLFHYTIQNPGDGLSTITILIWSILVSILICLWFITWVTKSHWTSTIFCTVITIAILLCIVIFMRTFHQQRWTYSESLLDYQEYKDILVNFISQLQTKTKRVSSMPFEFEQIRSKMISRIMSVQEFTSVDDAYLYFENASPEELFGFMSFMSDKDSMLVLKALECQNFYTTYDKQQVINLLFTTYKSYFDDDVTETNIYSKLTNVILSDNESKNIIPSTYYTSITTMKLNPDTNMEEPVEVRTANYKVDWRILNFISFTDFDHIFKVLPFKKDETGVPITPSIAEFKARLYSSSNQYIGSCDTKFDPNNVSQMPIMRFYMTEDRNPSLDEFEKIVIPELKRLRSAIMQLRDRTNANSDPIFKRRMYDILYFVFALFIVPLFQIFHIMYESFSAIVMTLSVFVILACVGYLYMFVP